MKKRKKNIKRTYLINYHSGGGGQISTIATLYCYEGDNFEENGKLGADSLQPEYSRGTKICDRISRLKIEIT
jgi:hypothetical protein